MKPFEREEVTVISLLYMGPSPELKEEVVRCTSKPAVLSQSLLAKAIDELIAWLIVEAVDGWQVFDYCVVALLQRYSRFGHMLPKDVGLLGVDAGWYAGRRYA